MSHRIERVNSVIRQELSILLQREIKDPRLSAFVSINAVDTSDDLKFARVYVSCICEEGKKKEIMDGLTAASGFLRNELSRLVKMRRVPELHFSWDISIERGAHLMDLIDKVNKEHPPEDK